MNSMPEVVDDGWVSEILDSISAFAVQLLD